MSRPLYWPQTGQTRCGSRGELQFGQCEMLGDEILCCDRRLFVRECDCRCLGTAMATEESSGASALVELQLAQLGPAGIGRGLVVMIRARLVQVLPAHGAKSLAVLAAHDGRR